MTETGTDPYEYLASLIERELQLVGERRFDELLALKRERSALQASLPATPPGSARPALERCMLLHKRVEIELLRMREGVLIELEQVRRAQRAARGYAPVRTPRRRIVASA
jgi:hypothetical protein